MTNNIFPPLQGAAWESTKKALHGYSKVVGAVPRAFADPHPKWWHISLKVSDRGLVTSPMGLPDGRSFTVVMDLMRHEVAVEAEGAAPSRFSMRDGISPNQMAARLFLAVESLGVSGSYAKEKYASDESLGGYEPQEVDGYFSALKLAAGEFERHRAALSGKVGPVQLWPHGFDLAFEWFGTRVETYEEDGEVTEYASQLNLGFSPGEPSHPAPYFYSNPWPFEKDVLLTHDLPAGARWFTEGWEGSLLEYANLEGDPNGAEKLAAYARRVYEVSAPTLTA